MLAARQFPHCQRNCFFFVFTWSSCIDLVYRSTPTGVIFPKRFCFQWNMLYFSLKRKRTGLRMLKNLANFLSSLFVICITLFHSSSFLVYHCHLCVLSILPSQENVSFFFFSHNENVVFRGAKMTQKITRWKGRKIVDRCLTIPKSASCYVSNITSTKMRAALQTVRHNYQNCTFALINSLVLRIGNFFFLAFTHAAIFTETF